MSCKKEEPHNEEPEPTINVKTVVIDTLSVVSSLEKIDTNTGTIYFKELSAINKLNIGDIICSAPSSVAPDGFFYKIKGISKNGNNASIEIDEASLTEAVEDVDIDTTINLEDYIIGIYDENDSLIESSLIQKNLFSGNQVKSSSTIINFNKSLKVSSGNGEIGVTGSVLLKNDLEINLKIKQNKLQKCRIVYSIEDNLKLAISGEIEGKLYNKEITVAKIRLKPIVKMVGYVPLVFTQNIPIVLKVDLAAKMQGTIETEHKSTLKMGTSYENEKFDKIFEIKHENNSNAKVTISGELKVTLEPQYRLSFYGLEKYNTFEGFFGLYSKATLSQDIVNISDDSRYGLNPELTLNLGAKAGGRVKFKFFSIQRELSEESELFEVELFRRSVFPQWDMVENNVSPKSANLSAKLKSDATFFSVSQYGIVVSKDPLPKIEDGAHSNLGPLPDNWPKDNPPVASLELNNLQQKTKYYTCPYFVNWFGNYYGNISSFTTGQFRWKLEADLMIDGKTEHYSSDIIALSDNKVSMPGFKWKELDWGTYWGRFGFCYTTTFSQVGFEKPWGWDDDLYIHLLTSNSNNPEVGEVRNGVIEFSGYSWVGPTSYRNGTFGGTFTLTRIE